MFFVEFREINSLTGKMYTPCGSANTRFFRCKNVRTVEKHLKDGVKPPKNTKEVKIFNTTDYVCGDIVFIKNFPVQLVGIDYINLSKV